MPTYEYECSRCGLQFERQQSIKDEPLKECPECGERHPKDGDGRKRRYFY